MERNELSRRDFMIKTAITAAAAYIPTGVFAQGSAQLKVGLIGCGGRGSGAAAQAIEADPGTILWAMGDAFSDRLASSRKNLTEAKKDRIKVTDDRCFTGFDAYKAVIASGVDVVILATPPGFRPIHLRAAVDAGKHVFMEKPVAVDGPGIRSVIESAAIATRKGLNIVAGTQRRHDVAYREVMKRIHDGELGDITSLYAYWNQGGLWNIDRTAAMTDMEWQMRNWLYFTWLSGDHIVEQHVHNLDVCNWAMNDHPVKCTSLAGRQVRTDPKFGHIFDHFATEYEYANGVKMNSMCRQIDGTATRVSEQIVGSKGVSNANTTIRGQKSWQFEGQRPDPYVEEHRHLFTAIRSGKNINEGRQVAESTLTAIMGRMSAYSGQEVTWEQALNSAESIVPATFAFGPIAVPPVAIPGTTKVS